MTTTSAGDLRQALFAAVEVDKEKHQPLVDLFLHRSPSLVKGTARDQRVALLKCVGTLHKGHARRFFHAIREILSPIVEEELFVPESAYEEEEDEAAAENNVTVSDAQSSMALSFVKVTAHCMEAYLQAEMNNNSKKEVIDEVLQVMQLLHDSLFSLQATGEDGLLVQHKICTLCELWWQHDCKEKENMVVQLVPLLVAKTLEDKATKADVKRLLSLNETLAVLDWQDESSTDLKSLLLRTVSSPLFLKTPEGKRLISYLFEHIPEDLHQAMRVQIPKAKKMVLEAYGEIYFRAWKNNATVIEETVLADLCFAILHVATTSMSTNLYTVLQPFHGNHKQQSVQQLLHRLYGPILWRSLRAANPQVRVNAATVLGAVFPLADGVDIQKAVQTASLNLRNLLQDVHPRVRVAGSSAAASVLATYWDAMPTNDIRTLLQHICTEHASDASSSAVRAGALTSMTRLLDAPESHAVLRSLLPMLGNLIHDKVERVRLASVHLLQKVKSVPGIKYYHVVPVDHLLARLANEGPSSPVASALTKLVMNSYFPQGRSGSEQVERTLKLLSADPLAAHAFYTNLSNHLAVNSIGKLAAMLLKCLVAAATTSTEDDEEDKGDEEEENKKKKRRYGQQNTTTARHDSNTALMASVAETICTLWESIESKLNTPDNSPSQEFLENAFSGDVLATINAHFEANGTEDAYRVCSAMLRCAGRVPPKSVQGLSDQITERLEQDHESDFNITPHVALLCLWGNTEEVATSLAASIVTAFGVLDPTVKRKSKKMQVPQLSPGVALQVLENILRGPDPSSVAARHAIMLSEPACVALENALEQGTICAERILASDSFHSESDVEIVLRACETFGRFALHKEAIRNGTVQWSNQAKTLLEWTTNRVIPVFTGTPPTPFRELDLSRISTVPDTPSSPIVQPMSKRTDRKRTPLKLDYSFQGVSMDVDVSFAPSASYSKGAALSLLQSSCILFSEWLAVGGSGADEICAAALTWCVTPDLLPALWRLAVQLCKSGEPGLVGKLLSLEMIGDDTVELKKTISTLLNGRNDVGDSMRAVVFDEILHAARGTMMSESASPINDDVPSSWDEVVSHSTLSTALAAVGSNKKSSVAFAEKLVSTMSEQRDNHNMFQVRCLWFLCEESADKLGVRTIVRSRLNSTQPFSENVQDVVENLVATYAV